MSDVTEQELHAYVDEALDPARRQAVEAHLARTPEDAARVAAWRRQKEGLHALFDATLDEPLPSRLAKPPGRFQLGRYAALLGWLAVGLAAGWVARGSVAPSPGPIAGLPREAAVAHVVYSPEVLHPVEVGAEQEAHLVKWLSKRLGAPLRVPDLNAAGFQLVGGRLLPAAEGPAAQFMYQDAQGQRLTLYVRAHRGGGGDTAFRYEREDGVGVFYWVDGGLGYALSGALDRARLLDVARRIYQQLG